MNRAQQVFYYFLLLSLAVLWLLIDFLVSTCFLSFNNLCILHVKQFFFFNFFFILIASFFVSALFHWFTFKTAYWLFQKEKFDSTKQSLKTGFLHTRHIPRTTCLSPHPFLGNHIIYFVNSTQNCNSKLMRIVTIPIYCPR